MVVVLSAMGTVLRMLVHVQLLYMPLLFEKRV